MTSPCLLYSCRSFLGFSDFPQLALQHYLMLRSSQNKLNINIYQMVERIMVSGRLNRRDHLVLTSAILSDDKISEDERYQINRVFDYIQIGRLKFVD